MDKSEQIVKQRDDCLQTNREARAFDHFRRGQRIPFLLMLRLGMSSLILDPLLWIIKNYPGALGIKIRLLYYAQKLRKLGRNCIIDEGVMIYGAHHVSIDDFVWLDRNVELRAVTGEITIGRRVHIAPGCLISGAGHVHIGDYVGLSRNVMLFSITESPREGGRMSGPMVPEEFRGLKMGPIVIEKDGFLGTNAVVLPGVTIGEGAVVGANSLVVESIPAWSIALGVPAKIVGTRAKVTADDI